MLGNLFSCHDAIDTNQRFNFLDIGEKVPLVFFLRLEVAWLKKEFSQKIMINNLFIIIENGRTSSD